MTTLVVKPTLETDSRYWDESGGWYGAGLNWFTAGRRAQSDPDSPDRLNTWAIVYFRPGDASLIGASFLANTKMRLWAAFSDTGAPCTLLIHTVLGNPTMPTSAAGGNAILASSLSTASVAWSPEAMSSGPPRDILQTPDLSSIISEWAAQGGMTSSWPLGFVFVPNNIDSSAGQVVRTWRALAATSDELAELTLEYSTVGLPTISSVSDVALTPTAVTVTGTNLANLQAVQIVEGIASGSRDPFTHPFSVDEGLFCAPISTAITAHSSSALQNALHSAGGDVGHSNWAITKAVAAPQHPLHTFTLRSTGDYAIDGVDQANPGNITVQLRILSSINTTLDAATSQTQVTFDRVLIVFDADGETAYEFFGAARQSSTTFTVAHYFRYSMKLPGYTVPFSTFSAGSVSPALANRPSLTQRNKGYASGAGRIPHAAGNIGRAALEAAVASGGDLGQSLRAYLYDSTQLGFQSGTDSVPNLSSNIEYRAAIFPAVRADGGSATVGSGNLYQGIIKVGALLFLPTSVNVNAQAWTNEAKVVARTAQRLGFIVSEQSTGGNKIMAWSTTGEDSPTSQQVTNIKSNLPAIFDLMSVGADNTMLPAYWETGNKTKGNGATPVSGASFPDAFQGAAGGTLRTDFTSVVEVSSTSATAVSPALAAGLHDTTVSTTVGESATFSIEAFDPPTITSVDVGSGDQTGGTTVVATGTNFRSVANVGKVSGITVGGVAATGVTALSDTTVRFQTPTGSVGAQDIVLTTPGGSDTLTDGFTYLASDITVDVPTASIVITPQTPTVDAAVTPVAVDVPPASIVLTAQAPEASVSVTAGAASVDVPAASIVLTPQVPGPQLSQQFTIPGRGPISVTISL